MNVCYWRKKIPIISLPIKRTSRHASKLMNINFLENRSLICHRYKERVFLPLKRDYRILSRSQTFITGIDVWSNVKEDGGFQLILLYRGKKSLVSARIWQRHFLFLFFYTAFITRRSFSRSCYSILKLNDSRWQLG